MRLSSPKFDIFENLHQARLSLYLNIATLLSCLKQEVIPYNELKGKKRKEKKGVKLYVAK
jgi:hypothetical protein